MLRGGRVVAQLAGHAASPPRWRALSSAAECRPRARRSRSERRAELRAERASLSSAPSADAVARRACAAFLRVAALVAHKDVLVELRSRELALTTLFFAVVAVLVFAFAFVAGRPGVARRAGRHPVGHDAVRRHAGAGARLRSRAVHQTLPALLSAPVDRAAIYAGKVLGLVVLLAVVLAVVIRWSGSCSRPRSGARPFCSSASLAAGVVGLVAVGSLFAAMLVRTRSRDVLLPVLLYPMAVPVLLAGVRGTAALLQPTPDRAVAAMWLAILVCFDAVFVTLALWAFDAVTAED